MLDTTAITGAEMRLHHDDYIELICSHCWTWPGNTARNVWMGTVLIEDADAPRLPRVPL